MGFNSAFKGLKSHALVFEVNAGMHKFSKTLGTTSQILGARRVPETNDDRTEFTRPGNAHPWTNNAHLVLLMKGYMRMLPTLDALKNEAGGGDMYLGRKPTSFFISAPIYDDSAVLLYV